MFEGFIPLESIGLILIFKIQNEKQYKDLAPIKSKAGLRPRPPISSAFGSFCFDYKSEQELNSY
jgi:hypothetical protein